MNNILLVHIVCGTLNMSLLAIFDHRKKVTTLYHFIYDIVHNMVISSLNIESNLVQEVQETQAFYTFMTGIWQMFLSEVTPQGKSKEDLE